MEWMILPLKHYAQFSGRSRRKEYWMYVLFVVIASLVLSMLDGVLGLGGSNTAESVTGAGGAAYRAGTRGGLLANIFSLATLIPSLAVAVRRLHDVNRSGWWILVPLVPLIIGFVGLLAGVATGGVGLLLVIGGIAFVAAFIASIILLVWYCSEGTRGRNRFGDDPKADIPADLAATFE